VELQLALAPVDRPTSSAYVAGVSESETPRTSPPYAADEVTMLRAFLDYYRSTIRRQTDGLTAEQLAVRLPPSTMTLGGMLKHLAGVEEWWLSIVMQGNDPSPYWAAADEEDDVDWDWNSAVDDDPAFLAQLFDEARAKSDRILDELLEDGSLDRPAVRTRDNGDRATLRWVLVHLIEEYARHAGHADLIRESIDGATDL